jgi:hypothetical protein
MVQRAIFTEEKERKRKGERESARGPERERRGKGDSE